MRSRSLAILAALATAFPAAADTIATLDRSILDEVLTITRGSEGLVVTTASGEILTGESLRRIVFNDDFEVPIAAPHVVGLANQDRIAGTLVATDNGNLKIRADNGIGVLELPFFDLRAFVVTDALTENPMHYLTQLESEGARSTDKIILRSKTSYENIFIDSIEPERVRFEMAEKKESVALPQVRALLIAEIQPPKPVTGPDRATVTFTDGVRITGSLVTYAAGKLTLEQVYGQRVSIPRDAIRCVEFPNARVRYLSDLRPAEITHKQGLIDLAFPPRMNLNCMNPPGPLAVDGQIYSRGIGTHTFTSIRYDLSEVSATRLRGLVGLDDSAKDAARGYPNFPAPAAVQIVIDGKSVFPEGGKVLDIKSQAVVLDVPLNGAKSLILITDFKDSYDMLGRVNWADIFVEVKRP